MSCAASAEADRIKVGLIVNPIAGVGGSVGLKGSDGADIVRRALELGAAREAPSRAAQALRRLARLRARLEIVTYPGEMGADEAGTLGFHTWVLPAPAHPRVTVAGQSLAATTGADTEEAARRMAEDGVRLLLFAGGDGTARNIFNAVADGVPAIGIPAGVKIHSAVFANTPASAGELAALYLEGSPAVRLREAEVMDIDEDAFRDGRVSARLYGYLRIPFERQLVQSAKAPSEVSDEAAVAGIANDVIHGMRPGDLYLIGAGTTTRAIMTLLGLPSTLLGVDAVRDRRLVGADLGETRILELIADAHADGHAAHIVVAVIGGQGHVLGRGSQQFSPRVIRAVGVANIVIVATQAKLFSLEGAPLHVDTGDEELDAELAGWVKVVSDHGRRTMYRLG